MFSYFWPILSSVNVNNINMIMDILYPTPRILDENLKVKKKEVIFTCHYDKKNSKRGWNPDKKSRVCKFSLGHSDSIRYDHYCFKSEEFFFLVPPQSVPRTDLILYTIDIPSPMTDNRSSVDRVSL